MSPHRMRHSLISWWKVNVTSAARNAMVAPGRADVNSRKGSVASLFIGMRVVAE